MTLADVKTYFRTKIKVVPGGPPVGTPGKNRTQGVLDALDKVAEFAAQGVGGSTLTATFNAGSENTQQLMLGATTTYAQQAHTNVASATLDGQPLTLPLTLTAGQSYTLAITRTTSAGGAVLTLSA